MLCAPQLSTMPTLRLLAILYGIFALKLAGLVCLKRANEQRVQTIELDTHWQNRPFEHFSVPALQPVRTFIENSAHFRVDGDDEEWESLVPGNGLVYLGNENQPYTMSMMHQLRCIDIVRKEIVDLEANPQRVMARPSDISHHCVNYLRQMVLCRGDLELDPVAGKPHPAVFPDAYQCRDWETVYRAVEENQRMSGVSQNVHL